MMPAGGLVAISVTPLDDDGNLDVDGFGRLMDFYVDCGASGVTLLGVMGEANRMTDEEARAVVTYAIDAVAGRIPVLVGVTDSSFRRLTDLAHFSQEQGGAGVMVQPLAGLAGDRAIAGYFQKVTAALGPDIPMCVQDFPKASGVHISVDAWRMIAEQCPTVMLLKAEDEPGLRKLSAIRAAETDGLRRVTILAGNNGIHLCQELGRGADGGMTGFAFPDVLAAVVALYQRGEVDAAEDLFDLHLPVNRHELRTGIAMRKELLRRRGVLRSAFARPPAPVLDATDHAELDRLLTRLEHATGMPVTQIRTA